MLALDPLIRYLPHAAVFCLPWIAVRCHSPRPVAILARARRKRVDRSMDGGFYALSGFVAITIVAAFGFVISQVYITSQSRYVTMSLKSSMSCPNSRNLEGLVKQYGRQKSPQRGHRRWSELSILGKEQEGAIRRRTARWSTMLLTFRQRTTRSFSGQRHSKFRWPRLEVP
jgi:hypothetical protein